MSDERPKLLTPEERVTANVTTSFGAAAMMVKADRKDILEKARGLPRVHAVQSGDRVVFGTKIHVTARDLICLDDLAALLEGR